MQKRGWQAVYVGRLAVLLSLLPGTAHGTDNYNLCVWILFQNHPYSVNTWTKGLPRVKQLPVLPYKLFDVNYWYFGRYYCQ